MPPPIPPKLPPRPTASPVAAPAKSPLRFRITIICLALLVLAALIGLRNTWLGQEVSAILTTLTGTARLPATFPSDAPLYPGYHLDSAGPNNNSTNAEDFVVAYYVRDSLADVKSFYETALASNGWSNINASDSAGKVQLTSEKSDKVAVVIIQTLNDKSIVVMTQLHIHSMK